MNASMGTARSSKCACGCRRAGLRRRTAAEGPDALDEEVPAEHPEEIELHPERPPAALRAYAISGRVLLWHGRGSLTTCPGQEKSSKTAAGKRERSGLALSRAPRPALHLNACAYALLGLRRAGASSPTRLACCP